MTGVGAFQTGTSIGRPLRDAASLETILPEALADLLRDFLLGPCAGQEGLGRPVRDLLDLDHRARRQPAALRMREPLFARTRDDAINLRSASAFSSSSAPHRAIAAAIAAPTALLPSRVGSIADTRFLRAALFMTLARLAISSMSDDGNFRRVDPWERR